MPPKDGDTVALERRMDLASLFCMIGRHGPAVALALVAVVSVLAGFIIYRTVRGKRRKAADAAAAADGESLSPGEERSASATRPGREPSPGESTDVGNEGSSDKKEDADLFQSDLKIRHRRAVAATAEKKSPPYSHPKSDIQKPYSTHTTSEDTEEMTVVQDSNKVEEKYAEEVGHNLQRDTFTAAEMEVEGAGDSQQGTTDDTVKDVRGKVHDNSRNLKEPGLINDESHDKDEKVFKAEDQEDKSVTEDKNVSEDKTRQEEESIQRASNSQVFPDHAPSIIENVDNRLQDIKTTLESNVVESNLKEPVIDREDVPVTCISYGKDLEFEEENPFPGTIDYSNRLSLEEKKKTECEEAEEEYADQHLTPQPDTTWYLKSEKEPHLVLSPTPHCLNEPVKVENSDDDLSSGNTDAKAHISGIVDFPDLSSDGQQPHSEVKDEGIASPLDKDKDLTIRVTDSPSRKEDSKCIKYETGSDVVMAEESIEPHMPPSYKDQQIGQMVNNEIFDKTSVAAAPDTVTCYAENISALIMAESISHPHVSSCHKDQRSVKMINKEASEKSSVATGPDTIDNVTAPVIDEEMSCPYLPSICQDQKSDHVEVNETFDETKVNSAPDAAVCDDVSITTPVLSKETTRPDTLFFSQDQQTQNNEDFYKFTISAAPVMTEDPNPPICHLPCFKQSEPMDNDKDSQSSPGVGEESGISSMTVSPNLPNAGNEFDMTTENIVPPVMDCNPQSEERTEAQNSLFAENVTIPLSKEDTTCMASRPYPSQLSQQHPSEHTDGAKHDSCAANEDLLGHLVEDSFHRAMAQFVAPAAVSTMTLTDELQKDVKAVVELAEIKEKKEGLRVGKKKETETENEKEEDYERTEISIMEATMDNNEWIMDGNYQVHPWMNLSVPASAQDNIKTNQLPTEECHYSSSPADATCLGTDTPPPPHQVKQTSSLSPTDENTENNKKVLAVQPMPQNVSVTFRIHYITHSPYQTVAVTGNQRELGNWKEFIPLERAKDGNWATVVSLPTESHVEWKFVVVDRGEVCRWEECNNRLLDTGCGEDLVVHKWWGFL